MRFCGIEFKIFKINLFEMGITYQKCKKYYNVCEPTEIEIDNNSNYEYYNHLVSSKPSKFNFE